MGRRFPTPHTVAISSGNANTADGNYTCALSATGPCGGTIGVLNLAIYGMPNCTMEDIKKIHGQMIHPRWASLSKQHTGDC